MARAALRLPARLPVRRRTVVLAAVLAAAVLAGVLVVAVRGCAGLTCDRPAYPVDGVTISTGDPQGVYYAYGSAYLRALHAEVPRLRTRLTTSAGSVENLRRLLRGQAQLAFISADTEFMIGEIAKADRVRADIRALAHVYDEYVQIVVRAESTLNQVSDLAGRRVSTGAPGSSVEVTAARLLAADGMDPDRDLVRFRFGIGDSIKALRQGRIDAFFWVGGLPTRGITVLAQREELRLLQLVPSELDSLRTIYGPLYRHGTIPAGTYPKVPATVTIAVPSYLLVAGALDEDLVFELTRVLFQRRALIAETVPSARLLDPRLAIQTDPLPLHPGAQRYYRAIKP
jgi:TRAP transporter TAXI family solute receptor